MHSICHNGKARDHNNMKYRESGRIERPISVLLNRFPQALHSNSTFSISNSPSGSYKLNTYKELIVRFFLFSSQHSHENSYRQKNLIFSIFSLFIVKSLIYFLKSPAEFTIYLNYCCQSIGHRTSQLDQGCQDTVNR